METGRAKDRRSTQSGSYGFSEAEWTPPSPLARTRSPSQSARLSSLAYPETFQYGLRSRSRRFSPLAPLPEPQLLRLRPTSLRTQDISYLLTGVFRNLYTAEVIGEDVSTNLIKARGSENALHEEFVDELQQIRELYKQRLDEFEMLERHIIQACARASAEKERAAHQAKVYDLEPIIKLPPERTIFRWCVDNELLQKHHLICPDDYYKDTLPFCSAPKGNPVPSYLKLTFSYEKRSVAKKGLTEKLEASCEKAHRRSEDESDYTVDSLTWDSSRKAKLRTKETAKEASPPKNKNWMNHLRVPQRQLERLLLARMESQNHFLKNPRFFPPNTARGGRSLIFPPPKAAPAGEFPGGEPGQSYMDTPVFLAKPPVVFFTDYEIGSAYKVAIALQNTTATSRYLRVLPPSTPYFSLGLGMFPGKGGMVAPGMTCQYIVQFFPDCLGDFDDFILVETQSSHSLLIPLQARRPPPVLTLPPVLDCGYCLVGGIKVSRFFCKNVGFSVGKFCVMPEKSWPPPSFRAIATTGFVEQPPFGIVPSVFELAPGQAILVEVLFLPTSLGKAEQTFIITCDNCQIRELVTSGVGQLVALDLIYISGEKSQPEPGELTDLTAQYFIRFAPENLQSTAMRQLIVRNTTHVGLAFHWQIVKPNLKSLMPGETYSVGNIQHHPDTGTAFSVTPEKGMLNPHSDHKFILSFSPHKLKEFHSVLQLVLEKVPEPTSSDLENFSHTVDDVIVLEIEVKGSGEPFQVLLEPYALIIPGENYIGVSVKKNFKMWNNSKSCIRYMWEKISDCHIVEVEPCSGTIESSEVEDFELKFTGGVPGPTSQDLLCDIRDSPSPVVLHIEVTFKGPTLIIDVSALQFGLLRLGQKATNSIQIQNTGPLPATWCLKESPVCLEERHETVSPFNLEPSSGYVHPLGQCRVDVTLEARQCQCLQTVLVLEVANGPWSYLPVYAEVQEPYVYLQSSHVEVSSLYQGVPATAPVTLVNGTLLPTRFHWGKLLGPQASFCRAKVSPKRGTLCPGEELQLSLELTAHTQDKLTDLALPCTVSGMKKPLVLGIRGKPQGVQVGIAISAEGSDRSVPSAEPGPGSEEALLLDFGSTVPLRTRVNRQLILTNYSPIQTPFTLQFEYFGSPQNSLSQKPNLYHLETATGKVLTPKKLPVYQHITANTSLQNCPGQGSPTSKPLPVVVGDLNSFETIDFPTPEASDMSPALLKTARIREQLAKREQLDFMESMLSHGKGAAFFPHVSQGVLGAHQELRVDITGCANMWGEYWDNLICTVGDLPPSVIPVHMAVVGCPISSQRTSCIAHQSQKEPIIRFNTQVSGGDTVTRVLRLNNCSPCDIRLDWETYVPEEKEDQLVELLVFYGPPFPLQDQVGHDLLSSEILESSNSSWSPSLSHESLSSHEAAQSAESSSRANDKASQIISLVLQGHEGVPSDHLYHISPKQVVIPAGGSSTISISFTPLVLGPHVLHKVECVGYALAYMSLDNKVDRELPGRMQRQQDFAVGPLRLDLHSYVRPAQLSVELDYGGGMEFRHQASDLIPEQPCSGVLSELVTTHYLKLTNTTDIPHYFRLLVSRPFSISQDGASRSHRAPGAGPGHTECEEGLAAAGKQLVLHPQKSMLVGVSFSLSLELLSYQRIPADQMLPGVDIRQSASGEKEMVFTQDLLLEYTNHTTQVVPLRATVAVPELQLSTSWVDFGTCFVKHEHIREVYLMNLSGSRSYWTVLMGQKKPDKGPVTFGVSPSNGLLEARPVNGPPTSIALQVLFTARSNELYESTLVVEGVLGEKACTLRLRGRGSYDERFMSPYQL